MEGIYDGDIVYHSWSNNANANFFDIFYAPLLFDNPNDLGDGTVSYGPTTYEGHRAFGIHWDAVRFYIYDDGPGVLSSPNSYRMYIVDRSDTGAGNFDLVYQYESMTYDTRVLSPGSNPIELHARAGYSNGSGVAGTFYNFPRSGLTGMATSLSTTTPYVYPFRNNRLFDLDIDSDNTNGNSNPDFSPIEELTEGIDGDAQHPGKVLWVNSGDADGDGVPDYADGYDLEDQSEDDASAHFTPVVLQFTGDFDKLENYHGKKVYFSYDKSDPESVLHDAGSNTWSPAQGHYRLWTKDGTEARTVANDFIVPGQTYDLDTLNVQHLSNDRYLFFVEAVNPWDSPGNTHIKATFYMSAYYWVEQTVQLTATDVHAGVDANRDRDIDLTGNKDVTAKDKPFTFWLNNDHDVRGSGGMDTQLDTWSIISDAWLEGQGIDSERDLEDLARFQVRFENQLNVDSVEFVITDYGTSSLSINLFKTFKADDSYLFDTATAQQQLSFFRAGFIGKAMAGGYSVTVPRFNLSSTSPDSSHTQFNFLFDGLSPGTGALEVRLLDKQGHVIGTNKVWLNIVDVKSLYENWSVGMQPDDSPAVPLTNADGSITNVNAIRLSQYADGGVTSHFAQFGTPQTESDKDYILFVHGWRMLPWDKLNYGDTVFKRLYWDGYQGRFGIFTWPTEWVDIDDPTWGLWNGVKDSQNYDRSEYKAYKSAQGLQAVLHTLYNTYHDGSGKSNVRMFSHSMGAVVASEALRRESDPAQYGHPGTVPMPLLKAYVASQGATVANAYYAGAPERVFPDTNPTFASQNTWDTPDFYKSFPTTGKSYFADIHNAVASDGLVNFFNPSDYALGGNDQTAKPWITNQNMKPDWGYIYDAPSGYFYQAINPLLINGLGIAIKSSNTPLDNVDDRYEIFSFADEAHSLPLGREGHISGPGRLFDSEVNLDGPLYAFGNSDKSSHSAQFLSSNMFRHRYYQQLLKSFQYTQRWNVDGAIG